MDGIAGQASTYIFRMNEDNTFTNYPVNLTGTRSGSDVTLSWDPTPNATQYEILQDGEVFGLPTTSTTATLSDVSGSHEYRVRVTVSDFGGYMFPSDSITVT